MNSFVFLRRELEVAELNFETWEVYFGHFYTDSWWCKSIYYCFNKSFDNVRFYPSSRLSLLSHSMLCSVTIFVWTLYADFINIVFSILSSLRSYELNEFILLYSLRWVLLSVNNYILTKNLLHFATVNPCRRCTQIYVLLKEILEKTFILAWLISIRILYALGSSVLIKVIIQYLT